MHLPPQSRTYQAFPKMVYHPKTGAQVIINSEEERPEGYVSHAQYVAGQTNEATDDAAVGAVIAADKAASQKAADDADAARAAAKASAADAEKAAADEKEAVDAERARIKAKLDAHSVDYAPQLGLVKLQELETALDEHLATVAADDDGE